MFCHLLLPPSFALAVLLHSACLLAPFPLSEERWSSFGPSRILLDRGGKRVPNDLPRFGIHPQGVSWRWAPWGRRLVSAGRGRSRISHGTTSRICRSLHRTEWPALTIANFVGLADGLNRVGILIGYGISDVGAAGLPPFSVLHSIRVYLGQMVRYIWPGELRGRQRRSPAAPLSAGRLPPASASAVSGTDRPLPVREGFLTGGTTDKRRTFVGSAGSQRARLPYPDAGALRRSPRGIRHDRIGRQVRRIVEVAAIEPLTRKEPIKVILRAHELARQAARPGPDRRPDHHVCFELGSVVMCRRASLPDREDRLVGGPPPRDVFPRPRNDYARLPVLLDHMALARRQKEPKTWPESSTPRPSRQALPARLSALWLPFGRDGVCGSGRQAYPLTSTPAQEPERDQEDISCGGRRGPADRSSSGQRRCSP